LIDSQIRKLENDNRQTQIINLMKAGLFDLVINCLSSLRVMAPSLIACVIGVLTSYDILFPNLRYETEITVN